MSRKVIYCLLLISFITACTADKPIELYSPDKDICFTFRLADESPLYEVSYKNTPLIESSSLLLDFDSGEFGQHLTADKPTFREGKEDYELIVGKNKQVHSHYNEVVIPLKETVAPNRKINLVVRAFNDGVAFRYEFPVQEKWESYVLYDEKTTFNLSGNPQATVLHLPHYTTSHEGLYTVADYTKLVENQLMDMPATFAFNNTVFLAVTEANVTDFAGMYLCKENGVLTSKLSPLPGQEKEKVKANLPHQTPWRVAMIGDRIGTLMESDILTHLADPCKIEDTSWIRPGTTTFPWWNGTTVNDKSIVAGNNFKTQKYYIDFCARNGIAYHSIVEYGGHEWYTNDGTGYQPGANVDITKPVDGLDMKQICDYAKSKGVGVRVWTHFGALYPRLDEAFALFEEWGLSGLMFDFMDRDDQEMIRIQEEVLQKAAKHHLHIQFHGSSKPSGLHRTYPNEFTREGTLNYEVYKWDTVICADHDIHMPFTRGLAGATDYHLGGFRSLPQSQFTIQEPPFVTSTRCHMLAMYVVLESYLGMACDYPEAYEGQPGFEFIREIPTVWDETRVPDAQMNQYAVVARKKGNEWYVGALNNSQARTLTLQPDFLGDDNYLMELYTDNNTADTSPNQLKKQVMEVTGKDTVELPMASNGGAVITFKINSQHTNH